MNTWDDHDIFDGYGSYPDHLQSCTAFQQVFQAAKSMYSVFQLHTNEALKAGDGFFWTAADNGFSWMTQLGPNFAVAALDTRSGRDRGQILPPALIEELKSRVCTSSHPHLLTSSHPLIFTSSHADLLLLRRCSWLWQCTPPCTTTSAPHVCLCLRQTDTGSRLTPAARHALPPNALPLCLLP